MLSHHLLDVGGQLGEGLCVGQDGTGTITQEADIPDGSQAQLHWDVFLKRSIPEVLVDIPRTCRPGTRGQALLIVQTTALCMCTRMIGLKCLERLSMCKRELVECTIGTSLLKCIGQLHSIKYHCNMVRGMCWTTIAAGWKGLCHEQASLPHSLLNSSQVTSGCQSPFLIQPDYLQANLVRRNMLSAWKNEGRPTLEEGLHDVKAILQAERNHAHGRSDRVATADPVPEPKGIFRVNAKGLDQLEVGADSYHVLCCGIRT